MIDRLVNNAIGVLPNGRNPLRHRGRNSSALLSYLHAYTNGTDARTALTRIWPDGCSAARE